MNRGFDNKSKGEAKSRNECGSEESINVPQKIGDVLRSISELKGDKLDGLGLKELQQLEQRLQVGLSRVRSEKEIRLREENKNLRRQVRELCSKSLQDKVKELCSKSQQDSESTECVSNLEALQSYLEESSDSDTSLQLGL